MEKVILALFVFAVFFSAASSIYAMSFSSTHAATQSVLAAENTSPISGCDLFSAKVFRFFQKGMFNSMSKNFLNFLMLTFFLMPVLTIQAKTCQLNLTTPRPVLNTDEKQTICVKVGMCGFKMESKEEHKPLNIAIVLDKSGSMSGDRIINARKAASAAVELMKSDDIISIITYDSDVRVIVPATKKGDGAEILSKIQKIHAGGTTALHAGTKKGGEEVEKFLDKERINRVILLSDGLANVGPSTPEEAGELGRLLGSKGICVTTLGLGDNYNEDLMLKLSQASDGNHVYITNAVNMTDVFAEEFQTAGSVVAQEVSCTLTCEKGVRPIRILNRDGEIQGQNVSFNWNQLYSNHERYVLVEVEVPAGENGEVKKIASAEVSYANMETNTTDKLSSVLEVKFSNDRKLIEASIDKEGIREYAIQTANLTNIRATELRDDGKIQEARALLNSNAGYLREVEIEFKMEGALSGEIEKNRLQESVIEDEASWSSNRKMMRANQAAPANQQINAPVR